MQQEMKELTRAELEVMQILWVLGEAFVQDILDRMPEPRPAYNTVSTVMRVLEKKGVVSYRSYGKSHRYYPLIEKEEYTRRFMKNVIGNFFNHSFTRMVSFFCEKEELSLKETEEIIAIAREAIARKQEKNQ